MAHFKITHFIGYVILLFSIVTSSISYAKEDEALQFIRNVSDKAFSIMTSSSLNDEEKQQQLTELFTNSVDSKWISKFVIGRYWKELDQDKRAEYSTLFEHFLISQYVPKFKQYTDNHNTVNKVVTEGEDYIVYTTVSTPQNAMMNINYKVRLTSGNQYKVYDVIAEGISLLNTHRSEFSSVLSQQGMDAFIALLKQKADQVAY